MKNWSPLIYCILGALAYIVNSDILPTWSHALVGVFSGLIFGLVYWLIGDKPKAWIRVSLSVVVAILAAIIVRIVSI